MKRPGFAALVRWVLYGVAGLAAAALVLVGGLRYVYLLPIDLSRPVAFLGGHVVLQVPNTWTVVHVSGPPELVVLRHHVLDARLRLHMRASSGPPGSGAVDYLNTVAKAAKVEALNESRAASSGRLDMTERPWSLNELHEVAQVDAAGKLWHLVAEFATAPKVEYAPSIRADAAFFRDALRLASISMDSKVAKKIYDEWAPARVALEEAEADFDAAIDAPLLSGIVFARHGR